MTADMQADRERVELVAAAVEHRRAGRISDAAQALADARELTVETAAGDLTSRQIYILDGQIAFDQSRYDDALAAFDAVTAQLHMDDLTDVLAQMLVYTMSQRATVLRMLGRYDEAREALSAALELAGARFGDDSLVAAGVHNEWGVLCKATGEYGAALGHYHSALDIFVANEGEESDSVATLYHNLGGIAFVKGDLADAETWATRGVWIRERLVGQLDPTVALDQAALAPILIARGKYPQARVLLDVALSRLVEIFGPVHYEVAVVLTNLGSLAAQEQSWTEALDHLSRAARIKRAALGADSPELIRTLANLAFVAERAGDAGSAREASADALRIAAATLPASHPLRQALEAAYLPA